MKTTATVAIMLIICSLYSTPDALAAGPAGASIGGYGGASIPVAQDDAGSGALYGVRGRVYLLTLLAVEPSFTFMGSSNETVGENVDGSPVELEGPDFTSFSFNLLWGGAYYGTAGVGTTKVKIGKFDETQTTWNFGGGVEIGFGALSVDVSPRLFVVENGDGSRKNFAVMAGVNYKIF